MKKKFPLFAYSNLVVLLWALGSASVFIPTENVFVGLFRNLEVTEVQVQIHTGAYHILADGRRLLENDRKGQYKILLKGKALSLVAGNEFLGEFQSVHFVSGPESELKITLLNPSRKPRIYFHNLLAGIGSDGKMLLVNEVEMDKYIAGVTEAEAGRRSHIEFYKAQSILARTFALSQINKHIQEGFHVCDQVHCQAYYGKPRDYSIFTAVAQTRGLIVVDQQLNPIVATFHSNSGGQTANSEDVWGKHIPYLRSVQDSFSLHMPNFHWSRKMLLSDWLDYLRIKHEVDVSDTEAIRQATHFMQGQRKCCMEIKQKKILLKIVREDLKLRSSFFSIQPSGADSVLFLGRGFGHGVGLCQEGAMRMAKLGYTYDAILNFYYKDIKISPMQALVFYKDE
ncbi:MAG: SpoIID/LytB domain-containing protein [Bacteroidia bacterium]|nr:SpoIID/LytB domain-containing protein [Bacteroidia bacterium]